MAKNETVIFITLFFSMLVTLTGVGIVVPLLPVYAHTLGAKGIYIGLIFGAFSISRTMFLPLFGGLSDKKGRKPFIIIGLLVYSIVSIAFMLSSSVSGLITIRFFQGIASAMLMPVILAYIGDITPLNKEGVNMGLFNISILTGLSIGPLLGGAMNDKLGLQSAFFSMGILSFIGFLAALLILPPRKAEKVVSRNQQPAGWFYLIKNPVIFGLFLFRFCYTSCIAVLWGFLPVYTSIEFALSATQIGILVTLGVLISGIIQLPMGYLADRFNKIILILIGGLLTILSILWIERSLSYWQLFAANFCFGLGGGISTPALMALALQMGKRTDSSGTVMSIMTMGHSLGMMTGALFAGIMMDLFHLRQAFVGAAIMMTIGTVYFIWIRWMDPLFFKNMEKKT